MLRTRSPRKEKISNCYLHSNSLSNKMDNSLLAVRDINHKYIVVDERKLDFKPLGIAIKKAREAKGWTQEYLAQLVDLTPRSIMYIENRGQHPRLNKFYLITTLLDISVDQFFFPCNEDGDNNRRKQVDVLLNDMEEKELIVMEATAQGLKKARETAE